MKTPSELGYLLKRSPRPAAPADLLRILEGQIKLPAIRLAQQASWLFWRLIWIPLSASGAAAALAVSLTTSPPTVAGPSELTVRLVSASEDRAGAWGVFKPGLGDDNGNGIAIANDWKWQVSLRLDRSKSVKLIQIHEEHSNQIWTTDDANHWALVAFYRERQLNHSFHQVLGPFTAGTHQLDLYGQIDNRQMYGTRLRIEFTDGTSLSAKIPRSSVTVGQGSKPKAFGAEAPAPVIYGNPTVPSPARLIVDAFPEPVITRLKFLDGGPVRIEARGVPGQTYVLESATNLTQPTVWESVTTNAADANGVFGLIDSKATNNPAGFYRLRLP